MTRTAKLSMPDGVQVVVPDALNLITPYVLFEQQDWFEDEIKFLRRVLQPGELVLDIGANYGVYTFAMARSVGVRGSVFAFEPAATTADFLQQGIDANGFTQVVLERSALSDVPGNARLATSEHAELNALDHGQASEQAGETVRVATLDNVMQHHAWLAVDFVKIDAEGEESRIIRGGREFFARYSPLVMYEVKAGSSVNLDLSHDFSAVGYQSYRLIPSLNTLVPFNATQKPDDFALNLFCCKPDRAASLAHRGLLVSHAEADYAQPPMDVYARLVALPYGARLADLWAASPHTPRRAEVEHALADYLASQDASLSSTNRVSTLQSGLSRFIALCAQDPTPTRRASLIRIAAEAGERGLAVRVLGQLQSAYVLGQAKPDFSEPFLAPTARFDAIMPGDDLHRWMQASILETIEKLSAYSSYFTGREALPRLESLASLGYASEEMLRRLQLVRLKFPPSG